MTELIVARNIAPKFKARCSIPARKLGETLIDEKGVEFLNFEGNKYKFKVQDYYGDQVQVLLEVSASQKGEIEDVKMYCSCIADNPNGTPEKVCSHLWAAMVYFDKKDLLEAEFKELNSSLHRFLKELSEKAKVKEAYREDNEENADPYPFYIVEVDASQKFMCLSLVEKVLKRSGEWGKPKPLQDIDLRLAKITYPEDIDALQMILTSCVQNNLKGFSFKHIYQHKVLSVLDVIEKTGRAYYIFKGQEEPTELAIDLKTPWNLCMYFDKTNDIYTSILAAHRGNEMIPMTEIKTVYGEEEVAFFFKGSFYKFSKGTDRRWVDASINNGTAHFDQTAFINLMKEMKQYQFTPSFRFSEKIEVKTIDTERLTPILRLQFDQFIACRLSFEYMDGVEFTEFDAASDYYDYHKNVHFQRNFKRENEVREALEKLGFDYKGGVWRAPAVDLLDKVSQLIENGWKILANHDKHIQPFTKFSLTVSSGIDWLNLEGGLQYGERILYLPEILKAYETNANFVILDDGSFGMLPVKWLESNYKVLDFGQLVEKENRIQFSKAHALMIQEMASQVDHVTQDDAFLEICNCLKSFTGVQNIEAPETLQGTLRPYQLDGFRWMNFLNEYSLGGCLADDMGLGKTIQMIAMLLNEKTKKEIKNPSLIVVPTSIVFNWCRELDQFGPSLKYMQYTGIDRKSSWADFKKMDVILTTYGIMRRDCLELANLEFNYVILDEAQAIKNSDSQTAKCIKVLNSAHKISMTGTPIENNIGELWSQFEFLLPGFLGSRDHFLKNFHKKNIDDPDIDLRPLRALIKPFLLRRTKDEVVKDLPEKVETVIYCEMKDNQKSKYTELMNFYRTQLLEGPNKNLKTDKNHIQILQALMALRQICCHPELLLKKGITEDFDFGDSGKLETLMSMLEEVCAEGHKALVFSQFTSMLAIVRAWLDKVGIPYCYLDGSTPMNKRQLEVDRFQNDASIKIFLISLKAGGVGLNLTAADYVFIYDPWWNPAVEAQAIDRTHRIGQTKKIFSYRLITKDTIEEKVHLLQKTKRKLAKDVIDDDGDGVPTAITKKDLQNLFMI